MCIPCVPDGTGERGDNGWRGKGRESEMCGSCFVYLSVRDEHTVKVREQELYEIEIMKLTLEEQLRQVELRISANTNSGPDDPISQIKVSNNNTKKNKIGGRKRKNRSKKPL